MNEFPEQFLEFNFGTLLLRFKISFEIGVCLVEDHIAFKTKEFIFPVLPQCNFHLFLFHPMVLKLEDFKVYD